MRNRIAAFGFAVILATFLPVTSVYASSLDDVVSGTTTTEQAVEQTPAGTDVAPATVPAEQPVQQPTQQQPVQQPVQQDNRLPQPSNEYGEVEEIANALGSNNYLDVQSEEAVAASNKLNTWVTPFIQLMVYIISITLVLRVLIDLLFIAFPPCRHILANGRIGNAASQGSANLGPSGVGGAYGSYGGYGSNYHQANQMNNQAINNAQTAGASTQVQWVSQAALNAVASEASVGPDGKANNALKAYWKDMSILLVITPILLVLAVTGILSKFGIFIANILVGLIESIMNNV